MESSQAHFRKSDKERQGWREGQAWEMWGNLGNGVVKQNLWSSWKYLPKYVISGQLPATYVSFFGSRLHFCTVRMGSFCTVYNVDKPWGEGKLNFSLSGFTWQIQAQNWLQWNLDYLNAFLRKTKIGLKGINYEKSEIIFTEISTSLFILTPSWFNAVDFKDSSVGF